MPVIPLVVALLVGKFAMELWLDWLNRIQVMRCKEAPPEALREVMPGDVYRQSVEYTLEKNRLSLADSAVGVVVLAIVLFSGVLPWYYESISGILGFSVWSEAFFLVSALILISLPSLPLEWWSQFRLEEKFGFNKTTPKLWIVDKAKGLVVGLLIGFPLVCLLFALVGWAGSAWWIWGFVLFFGFQLLMMILYPMVIMPLFNKFTPLPEGNLRERLMRLANRTGFKAQTIQVMDGSRRSTHSNAFFTGFGRFRRIVLFDTLIEQLNSDELEAVLAHEIGHYKKGHIPKMLTVAFFSVFLAFALIAWLTQSPWFYEAFGFNPELVGLAPAPAFLLFILLSGLLTFWFGPLFNRVSRKHEYEADAFARDAVAGEAPLVAALRKLSEKNLSNLTPHPLYSRFYYSHPSLLEREAALRG